MLALADNSANMQSFQSLLSSIGGGQPKAPQPRTNGALNSAPGTPGSTRPQMSPSNARPTANNIAAGVKRKPEDQAGPPPPKTIRTEVKVPVRPPSQSNTPTTAKPASSGMAPPPTAYRGTARPSGSGATQLAKPALKVVARPAPAAAAGTTTPTTDGAAKPKRGFAAIMEKAKAAEEAAKAAGSSMIKHKTVEKMTKREREKAQQAAAVNGKPGVKGGKAAALADRSRSGTPNDGKGGGVVKKAPEIAYKGTMKGPPPKKPMPEIAYKGTMRKSIPGEQIAKPAAKKGMPQDKYGGYASWSDLSGAEDEEEEDYESDASSMMEAGLDDVEAEETMALRAARREDQEALEEENRLKREKDERKKKLLALSKSAAAKKKY